MGKGFIFYYRDTFMAIDGYVIDETHQGIKSKNEFVVKGLSVYRIGKDNKLHRIGFVEDGKAYEQIYGKPPCYLGTITDLE